MQAKTKEEMKELKSDFNKILQDAIEAMKEKEIREKEELDNLRIEEEKKNEKKKEEKKHALLSGLRSARRNPSNKKLRSSKSQKKLTNNKDSDSKIEKAHCIMEEFTKMLRTRQCDLKRAITVYKTQFKSNSKSYNPETEIAKDIRFKFVAKKPLSELRNIFNGKQESQYIKDVIESNNYKALDEKEKCSNCLLFKDIHNTPELMPNVQVYLLPDFKWMHEKCLTKFLLKTRENYFKQRNRIENQKKSIKEIKYKKKITLDPLNQTFISLEEYLLMQKIK